MSYKIAVRAERLGKAYRIYPSPPARLKQMLWRGRRKFFEEFWALQDCTFSLPQGKVMGIIGENGSGKSTLLQLVSGILDPTEGIAECSGRVSALLELGAGFNPEFSGKENVFLNASLLGMTEDEILERYDSIVSFSELETHMDRSVKTYSSGMYVRLAFAIAVHTNPQVLIVDEALSVGDFNFQYKCLEKIRDLIDRGTSILFVSHDISLVQRLCETTLYLAQGRVRALGASPEVCAEYIADSNRKAGRFTEFHDSNKSVSHSAAFPASIGENFGMNIEAFEARASGHRHGNGPARFLDIRVQGEPEALVEFGDTITIHFYMQTSSPVRRPCLSFYIVDTTGEYILGTNSRYERVNLGPLEPGELYEAVVSFQNGLRAGEYGITGILSDFESPAETTYFDFVELGARITAICKHEEPRWAKVAPKILSFEVRQSSRPHSEKVASR